MILNGHFFTHISLAKDRLSCSSGWKAQSECFEVYLTSIYHKSVIFVISYLKLNFAGEYDDTLKCHEQNEALMGRSIYIVAKNEKVHSLYSMHTLGSIFTL